jgi:hypothetical protein
MKSPRLLEAFSGKAVSGFPSEKCDNAKLVLAVAGDGRTARDCSCSAAIIADSSLMRRLVCPVSTACTAAIAAPALSNPQWTSDI